MSVMGYAEDTPVRPGARVAAVVVSYNSAADLPACLVGIRSAADGVQIVDVVVVDNGSTDASIQTARASDGVRVIEAGANLGYAAAVNRGRAAAAEHDAVIVLNPDAVLQPGALARLVESITDSPHCGAAVPRITTPDGVLARSLRREPTLWTALTEAVLGGSVAGRLGWGEIVHDHAAYQGHVPVQWATGATVLVSRQCWDDVGAWDESFFLYSEETDFMLRVRRHGYTITYVPQAEARHRGGESGTNPRLWALLNRNKVVLYRRSHSALASAAFRLALLAGQTLRAPFSAPARAAARSLLRP